MFLGSTVSRLATPLPVVSPGAASPAKKYRGWPLYADCLCPSGRVKTVKSEAARPLGTTAASERKIGQLTRQRTVQALTGSLLAVPVVSWKNWVEAPPGAVAEVRLGLGPRGVAHQDDRVGLVAQHEPDVADAFTFDVACFRVAHEEVERPTPERRLLAAIRARSRPRRSR